MDFKHIQKKFVELFEGQPQLFSAPGRINLIGEHTDYNEGFVLPAAIDKEVVFAIRANRLNKFRFFAYDLNQFFETSQIKQAPEKFHWANYLLGVIAQFNKQGFFPNGIDCVFGGNIPAGAGLSSSAAIECGFAFGINEIFQTGISKQRLVLMAQQAEHEYVGVMCGVMDQFASMFGLQGQAIRLDCRDFSHRYFPVETEGYTFLLCDSLVKHALASSEYNIRRQQCEIGVAVLKKSEPLITALRDATIPMLNTHKHDMNPVIYRRCKYIIEENNRVAQACNDLEKNELAHFGKLLYQSHAGLRYEYEVSCKELDILVDATQKMDEVLGARMMGGGFGGCTINLVKTSFIEEFKSQITKIYTLSTNNSPAFYQVNISDGTRKISNNG